MGEVIHTARMRLVQKKRPLREARLEGFKEPLQFGTHGGYAKSRHRGTGRLTDRHTRRRAGSAWNPISRPFGSRRGRPH